MHLIPNIIIRYSAKASFSNYVGLATNFKVESLKDHCPVQTEDIICYLFIEKYCTGPYVKRTSYFSISVKISIINIASCKH